MGRVAVLAAVAVAAAEAFAPASVPSLRRCVRALRERLAAAALALRCVLFVHSTG